MFSIFEKLPSQRVGSIRSALLPGSSMAALGQASQADQADADSSNRLEIIAQISKNTLISRYPARLHV